MATTVQRVNITLDADSLDIIKTIAKNTKTSVSKVCAKFVTQQLEYDEDAYWMKLIGEEKAKGIETIGHKEFWNKVNALQD